MKNFKYLLAGFALISMLAATPVAAQVKLGDGTMLAAEPYFIVTYVEAAPSDAAEVRGMLQKQRDASTGEAGAIRFEVLERVGRPNHFMILEAWENQAARDAHASADHTIAFRKALQPHLYNPYDERPNVGLVAAAPGDVPAGEASNLYVVTHVDIIPPEQFAPCERQVDKAGPCGNELVTKLVADSRKHDGVLRFDALTQANRPNHMTVVEMWESADAQAAHTVSDDVKWFRDSLSAIPPMSGVGADPLFVLNPMTGSLYDERFYTLID